MTVFYLNTAKTLRKTNIMKKITLLISSLSGGGAENVCITIANGLADLGWHVELIVLNTKNAVFLGEINTNVDLIILKVNHARNTFIPLLKYIYGKRPEQILVFNYELTVVLVILKKLFKFKTKIISRNINTFSKQYLHQKNWWNRFFVKPLIIFFYCKADHIINQCEAMRDDLLSIYPKLINKTSVIYNPVAKPIEIYSISHNLNYISKQNYLLCVGRLEKQKSFHYAIEAFSKLSKIYPKLRLKIVGEGSLECSLKQCAINFDVVDKVDFEGFQIDVIPYYLHAKATLLTSLYEGFPNVLIESITLGTPVIAFDCPSGPKEIIQPGLNGYLVQYKNIESLVNMCSTLINVGINFESIYRTSTPYKREIIIKQYSKTLYELR